MCKGRRFVAGLRFDLKHAHVSRISGKETTVIYVPNMRADMFIYRNQCIHNL